MSYHDKNANDSSWTRQFRSAGQRRLERRATRRERIRAEIERNRRGEYRIPTWVLAVALVALVGAWVLMIALV